MDKKKVFLTTALLSGAIVACGLPYGKIDCSMQEIQTQRMEGELLICVISDLHCRMFGRNQKRIVTRVRAFHPDLIVIPGDLFDYERNYDYAFELIRQLHEYPIFFVSGNHEIYLKQDIESLRIQLKNLGVHVLEDTGTVFTKGSSQIELFGLTDHGRKAVMQGSDIGRLYHHDGFRVLLNHRPELEEMFKDADVDLTISGHAHGGQWRIPYINQGIYAPGQGLLPQYTEGMHIFGRNHLYISRGLASGSPLIPRLYNNPEIGFIRIKGK